MRIVIHCNGRDPARINDWLFKGRGALGTGGLVSKIKAAQCDAGNTQAGNNCFFHCSRWVDTYIASAVPNLGGELSSTLALRARLLPSRNVKSLQFAFKRAYPVELFLPRRRSAFGSVKKIVAFEGILLEQKTYAPYTFEISLPNHN